MDTEQAERLIEAVTELKDEVAILSDRVNTLAENGTEITVNVETGSLERTLESIAYYGSGRKTG